jgi:prepilin-type N-terminal cleavage/methylation domain-containing protein
VSRLREDDGFTLIELLVGMLIMLIVFGAVLGALETFGRQSAMTEHRGDNQDAARNTLDRVAAGLRNVVSSGSSGAIERAATNDVVFRSVDTASPPASAGPGHVLFRRFCVDSVSGKLYDQTLTWPTATPPALPGTACPGTGWTSSTQIAEGVTTSGGNIFSFDPSAATVNRISIDMSIDRDLTRAPGATQLRSSIVLRNLSLVPTAVATCQPAGATQISCDSTGSSDPDGGALTYSWMYATGAGCTGATTLTFTQPSIMKTGLTSGVHCFQMTVTNPSGQAQATTWQKVTLA